MKSFFSKINQYGLDGLSNPLDYRRVLFINNLSLLSSLVSFSVTILIIFEGLFPQFLVTGASSLLFSGVVFLNSRRKYRIARAYFLLLSVIILIVSSFVAFNQGRYNETENILIGFMAVSYLLYDSKLRYVSFLLMYLTLMGLKFVKQQFLGEPYDFNFFITLQNVSILCLIVYLFADAFRKSLLRSYMRLKEKDELLYSMIDTVPLFIGLVDKELRYRMVNINYEISFGKKREEIIGSHVRDVLPENIFKVHMPMIEQGLRGESPEFLELTELPDGTRFYAGGKYMPVKSDSGDIIGVSVFVNDVTKLEEAKNKLQAANSTKDKLFSIIAHDIRGPLDLFEGLLDYSSSGSLSKSDFLKHQTKVRDKLTGLRETVGTLLEWARTQLDGVSSVPVPTHIKDVVQSNLDLYKELIEQKDIHVEIDVSEDSVAWVDTNHLKIGVRNIIHNALKFTNHGGQLIVQSHKENSKIYMSISDTGVGMDEVRVHSILKKELQHSKSGTAGEMGTGLGLSLSLELLEKNNCKVAIDSSPGRGTKINVDMQACENGV